jgi:hypothetical protein
MRKFDFRLADDDALILVEAYIKDYLYSFITLLIGTPYFWQVARFL